MNIAKLGLIAGNGRFPFLVLEEALKRDIPVVVAAIREETFPEIEDFASQPEVSLHWLGLGQLGKLIRLFKKEDVQKVIMAGQVKHVQIFSRQGSDSLMPRVILPDLKMARLFMSL